MKPRITYPRTVVLPKDVECFWVKYKELNPETSFNGWVTHALRMTHNLIPYNMADDRSACSGLDNNVDEV